MLRTRRVRLCVHMHACMNNKSERSVLLEMWVKLLVTDTVAGVGSLSDTLKLVLEDTLLNKWQEPKESVLF